MAPLNHGIIEFQVCLCIVRNTLEILLILYMIHMLLYTIANFLDENLTEYEV